jgi:hypothetical protein
VAIFAVMYVDRAKGALNPPPYPMRFDLTINEWWANLGCVTPDGNKNNDASMTTEITWTVQGKPFGNFAVCSLDVDNSWFGKYQAEQEAKGVLKNALNIAPTLQALKPRCIAISQAINAYLNQIGVPAKPTDLERSVNGLLTLDLSGHHPRFEDIRSSYIAALSLVPKAGETVAHHWLGKFLLEDMVDAENHKIDFVTLGAMRDCMIGHADTAPCKSLHYIYLLGVLATYIAST